MRDIIEREAEYIFTQMSANIGDSYWQGRLDSLAWLLKQLPSEGK